MERGPSKATATGSLNSRPSIKFGAADVGVLNSFACPNSREGESLMVGETWAHAGRVATSRKHRNSFIFRILRMGPNAVIALLTKDITDPKSFHVPLVLDQDGPIVAATNSAGQIRPDAKMNPWICLLLRPPNP